MQRLQLFDTPLQGVNLIEASAGTGKTFTITGLYLRLLLESGLTVAQILVVTYTRAATAELRERIRERLLQVRRVLDTAADDPFCAGLLSACGDRELLRRRLALALLDFDRAAIFTIHGFCQRVLTDSAFESRVPFETELAPDQSDLLQQVVDDFWRRQVQDLSPGLVDYLLTSQDSPDALMGLTARALAKPGVQLRGDCFPDDLPALERDYQAHFQTLRRLWRAQAREIGDLLRNSSGLNGNKYRKSSIEDWLQSMDSFLADPSGPWFERFDKFARSTLEASLKKGGTAPQHVFFGACGAMLPVRQALNEGYRRARVALLERLVEFSGRELRARKARLGLQSYEDLLLDLSQALQGETGERLAASIRDRYRAALIDEFQDTDPLQYGILQRVFGTAAPLFLVGDPKQAIYSFRGADIFAYLRARRDAAARFTLDVNWRSEPALLRGVNALFEQPHASFFFSDITYPPARPADRQRPPLFEQDAPAQPLRLCFLPGPLNKEQATQQAVLSTASEIARLLQRGRSGVARIGEAPLVSADIAVLVRTHTQGLRVREALLTHGIHSVQRSQEDVFHSHEALELERVLRAVADPGQESLVRAALASDMLGYNGTRLAALAEDDAASEAVLDTFQEYHRRWRSQGFVSMFGQLLAQQGVAARLLGFIDGERRLTNLLHLGELLHQQDRSVAPAMQGLLKWLAQRRQSSGVQEEAYQLRLESDQELVQIVTIHKSKGLEYPVVFHPFAWDGGLRRRKEGQPYTFHDPDQAFAAVLELGSPRWHSDSFRADQEELAESLRLLYVALTRAEHRCYLYWGNVSGAERSALAWLLHPPDDTGADDAIEQMARAFKALGDSGLRQRLEQLQQTAPAAVRVDVCDEPHRHAVLALPTAPPGPLDGAREQRRPLPRNHRVTSFSALGAAHAADVELPDYDGLSGERVQPATGLATPDIFQFPRGARAGSCLHAIFESLDFVRHSAQELRDLIAEKLAAHAIDGRWNGIVADMIGRVLDSELEPGSGLRLRDIDNHSKLVELGFYYPLAPLSGERLARLLRQQAAFAESALLRAIDRLSFAEVTGFMRGFIDLVFRSKGRFYLVDYKSNWLGDTQQAYSPDRLSAVMGRDGYYLQYLLYTLALHRYLRQRIVDYDYDRHVGAVFYLFLRGMDGSAGSAAGIYRTRPDKALIEVLDRLVESGKQPQ